MDEATETEKVLETTPPTQQEQQQQQDEATNNSVLLESPAAKPLAFTIDFGAKKPIDNQRFKTLVEKYQNRHRRGQSLSKFDDSTTTTSSTTTTTTPPTSAGGAKKHPHSANLPRKSSFHSEGYFSSDEKIARSSVLNTVISKAKEDLTLPLRNLSTDRMTQSFPTRNFDLPSISSPEIELKDVSSPELELISPLSPFTPTKSPDETFVCGTDFQFEPEPDDASDTGTYTLDADNYTEEQKLRMSIDKEFNIEHVSVAKKTQEYVASLSTNATNSTITTNIAQLTLTQNTVQSTLQYTNAQDEDADAKPIRITKKIFNKIMYPSELPGTIVDKESTDDTGVFTSITASGVLSKRPERRTHERRSSLVQSEIFVEAYTDTGTLDTHKKRNSLNLDGRCHHLPPAVGGGTKIPSPVHTLNRSRSRHLDLSDDSSLETESYLKPTQNIIHSLQARLSLDSDPDSDYDKNYRLNNETKAKNFLKKTMHVRHNSFDDTNINKISNKLEHFHNKNLQHQQTIDQTFNKTCNQIHRIQNSPNNSPIRRSSSFSLKNQLHFDNNQPKCLNIAQNNYNSPHFQRNVQRSASTANIKPNLDLHKSKYVVSTESSSEEEDFDKTFIKNKKDLTSTRYNRAFCLRRARLDIELTSSPRSDPIPKCPNTPEMRRKFGNGHDKHHERTVSVERKKPAGPEVQSRYMNISKPPKVAPVPAKVVEKPPPKPKLKKPVFARTDTGRFSMRTTPASSVPATTPPVLPKPSRYPPNKKGPRSNSTLSSREVEFQNWKRRKSYDPMKAAAEGKRKAELAKKLTQNNQMMTQSYNEDCDSSPSHSSSVHRSQSFHGTAALDQLISSDDEDFTLSGDEGFTPPTPSPCEISPSKSNLRQVWMERFKR